MNYYDHHIGDYDANTSHLTWVEDMAYTRLIRWYYRKEKPIPAALPEACRQVRAISKEQKAAVEAVLSEFFELRADGWHQDRCDEAIAAYQAGEPEREAKKANEETRIKRHREERAELFKVLTTHGLHAAWNIGIKELRELVKPLLAPKPATAPVTPATATQKPIPSTQFPDTSLNSVPDGTGGEPPALPPSPPPGPVFPPLDGPLDPQPGGLWPPAAGGTPPPPPAPPDEAEKSRLWRECKHSLVAQETVKSTKEAGTLVGGLATKYGQDVLLDALRLTMAEPRVDTFTFLVAMCETAAGKRVPLNRQEALEASNLAAAESFASEGST